LQGALNLACCDLRIIEVFAPVFLNQLGQLRQRQGSNFSDGELGEQGRTGRTPDIAERLAAVPLAGFEEDTGERPQFLLGNLTREPIAIAGEHPQREPFVRGHVGHR
jgi:hypothetical protein